MEGIENNETSDLEFNTGLRLGFGYEIEVLPRQTIEPAIAVDLVNGEQMVVIGVGIIWDL